MRRPDHLIYDRYVADQVRAYADKKGKRTSHKAGSVHVISHILRLFAFIKLAATISKYVEVARRLFSSFDLVYYKLRCCSICVHHGLNAGASQYFFFNWDCSTNLGWCSHTQGNVMMHFI